MEELFKGINLTEEIEVNAAAPPTGLQNAGPQKTEQGEEASNKEQKIDTEKKDLIEIPDKKVETTESSLHTEKETKQKTEVKPEEKSTLKSEMKDFQDTEGNAEETSSIKQKTESPDSKEHKDSSSSSPFVAFARVLHDEGVLSSFDEKVLEEKGAEGLIEHISREIDGEVEAYKESLPPAIKEIIDNYEEGVPLDRMINLKSRQIEYDSITDDKLVADEQLQKDLIKQELLLRGFDESDANDMVKDSEDLGKLEAKAKSALVKLKGAYKTAQDNAKKEAQEYQKQVEEQRKKQLTTIKEYVDKTEEVIPGTKLSKIEKERIYKQMTTVVTVDEQERPLTAVMALRAKNPLEFERRLNYFAMLGFFDEKPDFSKLVTTAKTTATKDLEKILTNSERFKQGDTENFSDKKGDTKELMESLKNFQKT